MNSRAAILVKVALGSAIDKMAQVPPSFAGQVGGLMGMSAGGVMGMSPTGTASQVGQVAGRRPPPMTPRAPSMPSGTGGLQNVQRSLAGGNIRRTQAAANTTPPAAAQMAMTQNSPTMRRLG